MSKCALVFTGGKSPSLGFDRSIIPPCDFVCAADSGLDIAYSMGYKVDTAIGDFDSLSDHALLDSVHHICLEREKDVTDTEALLQLITGQGVTSYVLVGGGEGRFDHLLHLYSLFATYGAPDLWLTARERLFLVRNELSMPELTGKTVSIIPATYCGASLVSSENLRWELASFRIDMRRQSISNRCVADTLHLRVSGDPVFLAIPFP